MRKINEIIIHCSDTQEGCDVTAKEIRSWHTAPKEKGGRGWRDIGYHYVIRLDGTIELGRPLEKAGAHCIGRKGEDHNSHSIGICYIGGRHIKEDGTWEWGDTRTEEQRTRWRGWWRCCSRHSLRPPSTATMSLQPGPARASTCSGGLGRTMSRE